MTIKTTKIGGGAYYAKVSDRLKVFRSENPRASIETMPIPQADGMIMFRAKIIKDKADVNSAESTGHSLQTKSGIKDFEKLETIAVGRALALLGYSADGEIASSEEMEEFEDFKKSQKENELFELETKLASANTREEIKSIMNTYRGKGKEFDILITTRIAEIKKGLEQKNENS